MENNNGDLIVSSVFEALRILTISAIDTTGAKTEPVQGPDKDFMQRSLRNLDASLSSDQNQALVIALKETQREFRCDDPGASVEWQFLERLQDLLHLAASALKETESESSGKAACAGTNPRSQQEAPPLNKCALSVKQENLLHVALTYVSYFGISPNLQPGVGVHVQIVHNNGRLGATAYVAGSPGMKETCPQRQRTRLAACVSTMAEFLCFPQMKQSFFIALHLNNMLAALLQLLHAYPNLHEPSSVSEDSNLQGGQGFEPGDCSVLPEQCSGGKKVCECSAPSCSTNKTSADVDTENSSQETDLVLNPGKGEQAQFTALLNRILSIISCDQLIREFLALWGGGSSRVQGGSKPGTGVPRSSDWLKPAAHHYLLKLVGRSDGIVQLYTAMAQLSSDNKKASSIVADVVARSPISKDKEDAYVSSVSKQLFGLLLNQKRKDADANDVTQLVGTVANTMSVTYSEKFHHHFHCCLMEPLYKCIQKWEENMEGKRVVPEDELSRCLKNMIKVYVSSQQPQASIVCHLGTVIPVLWTLFCVTRTSVYSIKKNLRHLLLSYLKMHSRAEAAMFLEQLCAGVDPSHLITVRFEAGPGGGLQAVATVGESKTKLSDTQQVEAVVDILHDLKKDGIAGDLLVMLLKKLTDMISKETQQADIVLPASMERLEIREERSKELMKKVTLLHLLASICEKFGSECLTDNTQILLFVKASLERGVTVCRGTSEAAMAIFETETISMAMGLLTAVMAGAIKMEEEHRTLLDEMQPLLKVIGEGHPDEFIQEMASDIRIAIATRGAVWSSLQESSTGQKKSKKKSKKKNKDVENPVSPDQKVKTQASKVKQAAKPLIEVLSDHPAPDVLDLHLTKESDPTPSSDRAHKVPQGPEESSTFSPTAKSAPESSTVSCSSHSGESVRSGTKQLDTLSEDTEPAAIQLETSADAMHASHKQEDKVPSTVSCSSHSSESVRSGTNQYDTLSEDTEPAAVQLETESDAAHASYKQEDKVSLRAVFMELCDPLLPVRGHALIALARLVEERDSETLDKKQVVQQVFEENMAHGDSYLYMAAIRGLAALADCFPESVVPFLATEFAGFSKTAGFSRTAAILTPEQKLKLGETLMKATRNLGETIPKYREVLLGAVLAGARDRDATVRASSVSNLAELCSLLRFSLGPVLQEVLYCCSSLLESDEVIVRQAAALTLAKILEGLDRDAFTVLESSLKDLYRLLKKVHSMDSDDAVRLHANIALVQLDAITRQFLFPQQILQKRIQVLPDKNTFR